MLKFYYLNWVYRFNHWILQWKQDSEGDIALVIFNRLAIIKYKEHSIINLQGRNMAPAGKWQGSRHE